MGIFNRLTPEEQAAVDAEKAHAIAVMKAEEERQAFLASPQGMARTAYERGDLIYQVALDLGSQQALTVPTMSAFVAEKTADPNAILNGIAGAGWELVNGSVVFRPTGEQSIDRLTVSGQRVSIAGTTIGYYLWRRRA
ncbi:hypothetical protein GCM10009827_084240 [Dactylosporangium maewongense]|uniref:Uncharacterized protein n=1 Tax=Dactylosporangium maewongense TaxID=634393 RepID=A0ABP4MV36_9ACTN